MTSVPHVTPFLLTRTFAHSKDNLFSAWTDREMLKHWFGPAGFALEIADFDLRPGGVFLYSMTLPTGFKMWGKWVFQDIEPTDKLVFVASFSDPDGHVTRNPMSQTWPLETLSTVTFTEETGRTTMALLAEPLNASEVEIATFTLGHSSMVMGWGGTLAKLEEMLATS